MSQDQPSATNVTNAFNSEDPEPKPTNDENPKKEENNIRCVFIMVFQKCFIIHIILDLNVIFA